jgi:Transglutaminase-like superfamily
MFRRFLHLPFQDKYLLLKTFMVVALIRLWLWSLPFKRLMREVENHTTHSKQGFDYSPQRIAQAVRVMSRYVPRATCLTQALAVQWLLADVGHASQLRLGVHKDLADFKAHAWLEMDGQVIIGDEGLENYQTFPNV